MRNKYQFHILKKMLQKLGILQFICFMIAFFISFQLISTFSAQQEVTLSFAVTEDEVEYWQPLIEQFENTHKNIKISLDKSGEKPLDGSDQLKTALISGFEEKKPYDLLYLDIIWVSEFASQGWLMDLTQEFPSKDLKKEFLVNEVENGCYGGKNCENGKLYRVPFRTDIGLLYYRKDLLEQAQMKPPKTFEELTTLSKSLQDKLREKENDSWGYLWPGKGEALIAMFIEVLHGYGGYWIKDEQVGLNQQEAINAVSFLRNSINNISPFHYGNLLEKDIINTFIAGKAVFLRSWPNDWAKAHESKSKVNGKIGIIPMVHAKDKTSSGLCKGGWGFGVARETKHRNEAIKAIKFFTSSPIQHQLTLSYGSVPSRRRLFFDPQIVTRFRHYPQLLNWMDSEKKDNEWIARPRIPQYTAASCILRKHLNKALDPNNDEEAVKKIMDEAAQETQKLLNKVQKPLSICKEL